MCRVDCVERAACTGEVTGLIRISVSGRDGGGMMAKYREGAGFRLGDCFISDRRKKTKQRPEFAVLSEKMDSDPTMDPESVSGVH